MLKRTFPPSCRLMTCLLRLGKANGVVTKIVDGVPSPQERVTEDSEGTHGLREVHTHEGRDAGALNL